MLKFRLERFPVEIRNAIDVLLQKGPKDTENNSNQRFSDEQLKVQELKSFILYLKHETCYATDGPPKISPPDHVQQFFLLWVIPQTMYGCHRWSLHHSWWWPHIYTDSMNYVNNCL